MARQSLRVAVLIVCLGVGVFSTEIKAQSPAPDAKASGSAVQTIDAASLSSVLDLDGPWRFHAGDDPHFADPALDDSSWPSIRPNQPFQALGIASLPAGYLWARIHLHVPTAAGRLALAVYPGSGQQYEVFVNGSRIASTAGMATHTLRRNPSFPVVLPPSGDIVLTIRFYCGVRPIQFLPFTRMSFGSSGAIRAATELDHLRAFNNGPLAIYACICLSLLMAITAMILYRSQRDHDEYLWLGILNLDFALFSSFEIAIASGWLPITLAVILLAEYTGFLCMAMEIEFVMRFTRIRRRWPIRIVQGLILIVPALYASTLNIYGPALVIAWVAMMAVMTACFVSAYRRGTADSGLFLLFLALFMANDVLNLACDVAIAFPGVVPWGPDFHFGPVGISGTYLADLVASLGLAAIVLYRFIRVARDEAHAAAELEAAREIQNRLVPMELPEIEGCRVRAAYVPAAEVGGDFFQVLQQDDGSALIAVGDVSGKGLRAAMTGALAIGALRTLADEGMSPAKLLRALNRQLVQAGQGGFVTLLCARLTPDGTLTLANAGHLYPYRNGIEVSIETGMPLGISMQVDYAETTLQLEPDDSITFLSDGVVEARRADGELFGFERTQAISSRSPQEIVDAAQQFGQEDDITVLKLTLAPVGVIAQVANA